MVLHLKLQHGNHIKVILVWKATWTWIIYNAQFKQKTYTAYTCNLEISRPAICQDSCPKCPSLCVVLPWCPVWAEVGWLSKSVQDTVASYSSREQGSRGGLHWLVCPVWLVSTPLTVRHQAIWPSRIFLDLRRHRARNLMFWEHQSVFKERYVIRTKGMSCGLRPLPHSHVARFLFERHKGPHHIYWQAVDSAVSLDSHLPIVFRLASQHQCFLLDFIQTIQHKIFGFCSWTTRPEQLEGPAIGSLTITQAELEYLWLIREVCSEWQQVWLSQVGYGTSVLVYLNIYSTWLVVWLLCCTVQSTGRPSNSH